LLAIILRKTIDLLASLCYNKIKEREGKHKGNPRERTEVKKMKGTEKQIKWAEDIKADFTKRFTYNATLGQKKTAWLLDTIFSTFTEAKWWIENREMLNVDLINYHENSQFVTALNKVFAQAIEINPELAKFKK
jgi:hypothetical protein